MPDFKNKPPVFLIKPLEKKLPPRSSSPVGWGRFALIALLIFILMNLGNIYLQGKAWMNQNRPVALTAFAHLKAGMDQLFRRDFTGADDRFKKAEESLVELQKNAQLLTSQANQFLNEPLYLDAANQLIQSGVAIAALGQSFTELANNPPHFSEPFTPAFLEEFKQLKTNVDSLFGQAVEVQQHLTRLNPVVVPADVREQLSTAQKGIGDLLAYLREGRSAFSAALDWLGDEHPHQTLVLLQNKNERRATGGFIGSYLLVTTSKGEITKFDAKDVYETDGQLTEMIAPPPGIREVADRWAMRDANFSPDFPTSAKKIQWFLEHSRGPTVDTVIAVDQTVIEKLLELTGPIELKGFPFTLKSKNVDDLLSFYTEAKLAGVQNPKQLLFDLAQAVKKEFMKLQDFSSLIPVAQSLISEGHVQLYSNDEDIQEVAKFLKMDGAMAVPTEKTDYLNVITTSIGGNKSDRYIQMKLDHQVQIASDGSVTDRLTITKHHTWSERDWSRFQKWINYYGASKLPLKDLHFILGGGPNVDYLRVYVPKGSKLLKKEGIETVETSEKLGYTV
ncbi:MAG: DUF4012 domain-containing protein, partial [Candidatus Peregrinibacteria bacterium]